jgi:predicted dehydrogenase
LSEQKSVGVGIIGVGKRGAGMGCHIANLFPETGLKVVALCDRNTERMQYAARHYEKTYREYEIEDGVSCYAAAADLIGDPQVQVIMVTSPQFLHREHGVAAIRSGKKVYLDKPLAHTAEDAIAIAEAERATGNPAMLAFTRRYEAPWIKARQLLADGAIGDLSMMLMRAVIPYFRMFSRWSRRREWSGGPLNDKSSHHFDVLNWFNEGARTEAVHGFGGVKVFRPDPSLPERCIECDRDCPYRTYPQPPAEDLEDVNPFQGDESWEKETSVQNRRDNCVYLPGADSYDHASVHFRYQNGVLGALFYSLFGPSSVDEETFELVGTKGRLIIRRHAGEIDLIGDHGKRREIIDCRGPDFNTSHYGADLYLLRQMRVFYDGTPPVVGVPQGLEATRMVMAALKSIDEGSRVVQMQEIPDVSV